MLNKEKYAKEIIDIACHNNKLALKHNIPYPCNKINCGKCDLWNKGCITEFIEWANSEYKKPEIDWTKVPVDTCLLISDSCGKNTIKRHFAEYYNKKIYVYPEGMTSWSFAGQHKLLVAWDEKNVQIQIKEGTDCSKWYKD